MHRPSYTRSTRCLMALRCCCTFPASLIPTPLMKLNSVLPRLTSNMLLPLSNIGLLLSLLSCVLGACYTPDGDLRGVDGEGGAYLPCNSNGGHSMCCALGRKGKYKNTCRPDGLCDEADSGWIFRESCTDPTWRDPACIKLCFGSCMSRSRWHPA